MLDKGIVDRLTLEQRDALLNSHPILEKNYRLPTPMLERTYALVRERVWMKRTGVYLYASPRMGKTTCAEEIQTLLVTEFPKLHIVRIDARRTQRPSEAHLYRLILEGVNHILSTRVSVHLLFQNVKADIMVKLAARGGTHFVLIIDEMHRLNDVDLEQLLAVHNTLRMQQISMTTISFAQPEIRDRVTGLMTRRQHQLLARFLAEPLQFEGCTSVKDLRKILNSYDVDSEYPEGSGWSYTRFFLPQAYEAGFRLFNYAHEIWEVLFRALGSYTEAGVPMEHVCLTVEYLLLALRSQDCYNVAISAKDITDAVDASNLAVFSGLMHNSSFDTS
ncbi:ATP-binding protein [Eoetvoesiella caeni]|uniref:AAA domain-containing protein n=1 Tax=Eoetvoesiella caeni TaxID=645616 RepID=A0A366GY34_9BURK|nr:ATP-binding protein [Eoetvoesiella caeni]MCI2811313.1 ATP-binding protein [Eoetvoesiella caeni]NYT57188.1 ATP-binding protein [Eoetvoesiella caeni]RBP33637.1 AAA domain-containing protein [Eoetvoesiella caeni]